MCMRHYTNDSSGVIVPLSIGYDEQRTTLLMLLNSFKNKIHILKLIIQGWENENKSISYKNTPSIMPPTHMTWTRKLCPLT